MVLPKYFLLTARKILILPKSSKLGGAIAPPAPPAGTAMSDTINKTQKQMMIKRKNFFAIKKTFVFNNNIFCLTVIGFCFLFIVSKEVLINKSL